MQAGSPGAYWIEVHAAGRPAKNSPYRTDPSPPLLPCPGNTCPSRDKTSLLSLTHLTRACCQDNRGARMASLPSNRLARGMKEGHQEVRALSCSGPELEGGGQRQANNYDVPLITAVVHGTERALLHTQPLPSDNPILMDGTSTPSYIPTEQSAFRTGRDHT